MSAKINLYNDLPSGSAAAAEPKEGYVYVVTKITFRNESTTSTGNVSAGCPGRTKLVNTLLGARGEAGWEGTTVVEYGESLIVSATPAVRCIVEGYFLLDVPAFARSGAGALDAAYAADGAIQTQDSPLAKLTYLMLVELKRVRMTLEAVGNGSDRDQAVDEIDRELGS